MKRMQLLLLSLALGGEVFALDRWTKFFFFGRATTPVLGWWLQTTNHHNFGLIANLSVPPALILVLTGLIAIFVARALVESLLKQEVLHTLSLALILSGALGNLLDRVMHGFVFDWILLAQRSVLNAADLAIGLGIILFIVSLDRTSKTR